jgi:hypothetical protein
LPRETRESDQVEPGPLPGGLRPLRPHNGSPMYTGGSGTQDGVNLGTAVRRVPRRDVRAAASNLDTHSTWVGRGAHAVEFSKTAAPPRRGNSLKSARPEPVKPDPAQTNQYSTPGRARQAPLTASCGRRSLAGAFRRSLAGASRPALAGN